MGLQSNLDKWDTLRRVQTVQDITLIESPALFEEVRQGLKAFTFVSMFVVVVVVVLRRRIGNGRTD